MSLLLHGRLIPRAVLGQLSPAVEKRLARHLLRCGPCAARHHVLSETTRALAGRTGPTLGERARARARLEAAIELGDAQVRPGGWTRRWSLAALAGAAAAGIALWLGTTAPTPSDDPTFTVAQPAPVSPPAVLPPVEMPDTETRVPFEGEPPGFAKQEVVARFDFEGEADRLTWNTGTIKTCPTSGAGHRCIVAVRSLPCCPWSVNVNWGSRTRIFTYADDLMVTFRYRTGESTSEEPVAMQLQVMDDRGQHYSFPFTARARATWHQATIPLSWLASYPDVMVGIKVPKRGTSTPLAPGTTVRSLQIMLRYAREDVLLVDDVELARFTRR